MITSVSTGNKVSGFYRGKVLTHEKSGKCKIMIYGVYPDEWEFKPKFLPMAEQATGIGFDNVNGNGFFSYPDIGAFVWCFFANEDQNFPVYFATCQGGSAALDNFNDILNSEVQTNKIKYGNIEITFNKGEGNISNSPSLEIRNTYNNNETSIKIDDSGNIILDSCNDIILNSKRDIKLNAKNYISMKADSQFNISANDFVNVSSKFNSVLIRANPGHGVVRIRSSISPLGVFL